MSKRTKRLTTSAMLLALMLILGYLESLLPSPGIPGIKLGLSNCVLLFALYMLDTPTAFCLMLLKVALSSMLFGGLSAAIYALSGGLMSMIVMIGAKNAKGISPIVVSMLGGAAHNAGQVIMAMLVLHNPKLLEYMAVLTLTGLACGALTGVCAVQVMKRLKDSGLFRQDQQPKTGRPTA